MSTFTLVFLTSGYLLGFAGLHTLMADERFKDGLSKRMPKAFSYYRLFYNLLHGAILIGYAWLFFPHDRELYRMPEAWHLPAFAVIGANVFMVCWVLFVTFDFREFAGLRFSKTSVPNRGQLKQNGPFRYCRHPVYLGTFLAFLASPKMTVVGLVFTIFLLLYGYFGSIPEERKLLAHFGDDYRRYQKQTKRLIPFVL